MLEDINIIGLGKAGCALAEKFSKHPVYKIYMLDSTQDKRTNHYFLPPELSAEDYEKKAPSLKRFFKGIKGSVTFVVCGSGNIAGTSLVLLEQVKHCDITILYIKPELDFLSKLKKIQERLIFNIFQQYARSGVFKDMFIVENSLLESYFDSTLLNPFEAINIAIESTYHYYNFFNKMEAVYSNFDKPLLGARIKTFGLVDVESGNEIVLACGESKSFYNIDPIKEKYFYYSIHKNKLKDNKVLAAIKDSLRAQKEKDKDVSYYFSVYGSDSTDDFGIVVNTSSEIQKSEKGS